MSEVEDPIPLPMEKSSEGNGGSEYEPQVVGSPMSSVSGETTVSSSAVQELAHLQQKETVRTAAVPGRTFDLPSEQLPTNYGVLNVKPVTLAKLPPTRTTGMARHRVPGKHQCEVCEATFSKPARLKQHMQTHSDERPFPCTWEGCDTAFKRKTHLTRHMMLHSGDCPHKCTWEGCDRSFVQKCQLDKHMLTHTTPKPYTCPWPDCGEAFPKHNKLRRHMCSHTGDSPYPCPHPECPQGFDHPSHLLRHVRAVHNKEKTNVCSESGCGEAFYTFSELRKHMNRVHPLEFPCEICGKVFSLGYQYKNHMKKHSGTRESFPCDVCEKEFSSKTNLTTHKRIIHEGWKPFACGVEGCKEAFGYRHLLERHIKSAHYGPKDDDESSDDDDDDVLEDFAPPAKRPKLQRISSTKKSTPHVLPPREPVAEEVDSDSSDDPDFFDDPPLASESPDADEE